MDHIKELALARMARGFVDRTRFHYGIDGDGTDLDGHAPHRDKYAGDIGVYHDANASDDLAWSLPPFKGRHRRGAPREAQPTTGNGKAERAPQEDTTLATVAVEEYIRAQGDKLEARVTVNLTDRTVEVMTSTHRVVAQIVGNLEGVGELVEQLCQRMLAAGYKVHLDEVLLLPLTGGQILRSAALLHQERQIYEENTVWINTKEEDDYEILTHRFCHRVRLSTPQLDAFCAQLLAAGFYLTVDRERYIPLAQRAAHEAQLARLAAATDGPPPERIAVGGKRRRFGSRSRTANEIAK